ncbi:predicted protein [Aspergillus nidulans FGSC A4]|uniref:Uncharacterized protein n=1 Tax=Emericella nidulans (strain FGSC A4 / ATCC 38163 / CBS 112.46 / NRRL 194 / M139) TaxID=227321 RepID=Q5ASM7_EMENI|nr:hypothetical protein [Aspergillus nidulans FGSC A4]EAA60252.1 predicted protein [Aspergillus nidulans FGSC A4]CBF78200.1 TPA: conserved hypothetical protein [Aspergillus nidulans FGSC A4]|eukprot:XP_681972.1 predicted protein [Aspergillus nidulans FGSC A4]
MANKSKKKKSHGPKGLSSNNVKPLQVSDSEKLRKNNTKAAVTSFHVEDTDRAGLPSPRLPISESSQCLKQHKPTQADSPNENSIRRRIRTLTLGSTKTPSGLRHSWEFKSSSAQSSHIWSNSFRDSVSTQESNSPQDSPASVLTIIQNPKEKGRIDRTSSSSSILKYIRSPTDYMMIDLDYCEAQAAMNSSRPNTSAPKIGKSSFDELLAYVRRVTRTEIRTIVVDELKAPCRPNEARIWDHRNLWCVDCQEVDQKAADENLNKEVIKQANHLARIIEYLSIHAKDVSTFSQCTLPDGCGRYVCPNCCGVCPNEVCRDIQCKECKPNVWETCDWHN